MSALVITSEANSYVMCEIVSFGVKSDSIFRSMTKVSFIEFTFLNDLLRFSKTSTFEPGLTVSSLKDASKESVPGHKHANFWKKIDSFLMSSF